MLEKYTKRLEEEIKDKDKLIKRLGNMLKDKEERIDKAIEYIEKNTEIRKATFYGLPNYEVFNGYSKDILEILKGEDKE